MLDIQQIDQLKLLLSTDGWNLVMKPAIENRIRLRIKSLVLHPSERPEEDRDDQALRGKIQELEWMLVSWANTVQVFEHNQRLDELDRAAQENGTEMIGSATPANP